MLNPLTSLLKRATAMPKDPAAANAVGEALARQCLFSDAERWFREALLFEPDNVSYLQNLADVLRSTGAIAESEVMLSTALRIDPRSANLNAQVAELYLEMLGDPIAARRHYLRSIDGIPSRPEPLFGLCRCYIQQETFRDAFRRAKSEVPFCPETTLLRAFILVLLAEGRYDELEDCCERLLTKEPQDEIAFYALATEATERQNFTMASWYHEQAIAFHPCSSYTIQPYIRYLALLGKYESARTYYRSVKSRAAVSDIPVNDAEWHGLEWDGSSPDGATILLYSRFGFGDAIQFARYAKLLKDRGAKVLFLTHKPICSLIGRIEGIDYPFAVHEEHPRFDYVFNPALLWLLLDVEMKHQAVYLTVPPTARTKWKARLSSDKVNIGLCWYTSCSLRYTNPYTSKSMPFSHFEALSILKDTNFYSLQVGPYGHEHDYPSHTLQVTDFTKDIGDFMDTAAFIAELDLVITVDTCVAHIAGALGKPTFLLVPYSACWRWMLDTDTTSWYPSLRIFRQQKPGDWNSVVSKVVGELEQRCNRGDRHTYL